MFSQLPLRAVGIAAALAMCLATSGCTSLGEYLRNGFKVGPNYRKPPAPVADEWIDSRHQGVDVSTKDLAGWWHALRDPKLDALVEQAYQQNLTLRTAGTRILAARAQRNIAIGYLFPQQQQAFGDYRRTQTSLNVANPLHRDIAGVGGFGDRTFNDTAAGVNLAWEIDFWGRFRRGIEASNAALDASVENYDDALVLLIGEVASTYVEIRVFQQQLRYVADNIAVQEILAKQAEDRLQGGAGRKIDQAQMRSNLRDTLAIKEQLEISLRQANNRLCVLLGMPVRDLMPELGDGPIPTVPPEVAVGMPVDLLRRRPDLRRAERLVAAQSARIGIATADLYPRLSLIGSIGYESTGLNNLVTPNSFIGSVGPSLRWDILNYGRLVNGIRVQDALFQTAAVEYQNAVLQAGREVEDNIVFFLRSQTRTRELSVSAKEAKIAVDEAVALSKDVKFDLNQAFVTSNFLVGQQNKLAQAQGDIALSFVQIYKALGGGWEIRLQPRPPMLDAPVERFPAPPPQPVLPMGAKMIAPVARGATP
ncbi:MAG TPA: efflux transporter outer membrane subunit [Gemmataceae bacterium]|nr:efflux transporter outer membrane subunit [Gemmataceae bacterium]